MYKITSKLKKTPNIVSSGKNLKEVPKHENK